MHIWTIGWLKQELFPQTSLQGGGKSSKRTKGRADKSEVSKELRGEIKVQTCGVEGTPLTVE